MALYPLLVLALAVCGRSWPQISFDNDLVARDTQDDLRQLPYTTRSDVSTARGLPVVDDGNDMSLLTLPIPDVKKTKTRRTAASRRQLPVDEELGMDAVTLPVAKFSKPKPKAPRGLSLPADDVGDLVTLPVATVRKTKSQAPRGLSLPVDEDVGDLVTLPVYMHKAGVSKRQLSEDDTSSQGVLTLPVIHSTKPGVFKRAVELQLANRSDVAYYAQLNFGTPPQPVFVQLDTGSFELWVNPDCSILPERDIRFCEAVGSYDAAVSTTAGKFAGNKTLRYGIGAANVTYIRDSIGLPGSNAVLKDVQFGVATGTEDQFAGILGIGYGEGITTQYKNFIDELADQGVTKTKAFSIGLGSKDDQEGVIVFGGVDTAKFSGWLAPLPIIPAAQSPDGVPRYWVQMKGITLEAPNKPAKAYPGSNTPVFLDSGATLSLLPQQLAEMIAADFGSPGEDENGFFSVDCKFVGYEGTLDFEFDGVTIRVPYREMIRELSNPPRCYLGIVASQDFILLGDTFLRSAYVVIDADTKMAYMAQYANCGAMVKPINTPTDISTFYGLCGLTENSVLPGTNASAETDSTVGNSGQGVNSGGRITLSSAMLMGPFAAAILSMM
ncbi:hypothetical protein jhhlp_000111 [Lomentospora prolificans]|uniref:Peptidase A1 domain-containing protein n=1 Tax=Lomentospora prolificans TaxID=41688 RepID=A0A2N3NLL9_9PEZI|nr:hypothetical protein jhhlp_000111 [Lomentospora prolificans]